MNKCKTELQYWRSKSSTLLNLPTNCASCEAPLLPQQQQQQSGEAAKMLSNELKALANQGVFLTDEDIEVQMQPQDPEQQQEEDEAGIVGPMSPAANTRGSCAAAASNKSGPPSPASVGRKRRSRDDLTSFEDADLGRKNSLRGGAMKGARTKRPKIAGTN